jgi:antagonist of KipI
MEPTPPPDLAPPGLRVLDPGLYTLVVDHGRPRSRSLGVPLGGAADQEALALGNALVGNPADAAALEITLAGPTLEARCALGCVLYGAPFALASDRSRRLTAGTTFTLAAGERLRVGPTPAGVRAYFCVRGGLDSQVVLGSRSGLTPVAAGDEIGCRPGSVRPRFARVPPLTEDDPLTLRALDGPQADWFAGQDFFARTFTISPAGNRMGLRLQGPPLRPPGRELVSEPVCPGAVQVTSDGQCIVLGVDGQTIGGYPKVAQVITADLDKLGRLRPGERIRFVRVRLEEAEEWFRRRQAHLREWVTRLRVSVG